MNFLLSLHPQYYLYLNIYSNKFYIFTVILKILPDIIYLPVSMHKEKLQLWKQMMKKKKQQAISASNTNILPTKQQPSTSIQHQHVESKQKPSESGNEDNKIKQQDKKPVNLIQLIPINPFSDNGAKMSTLDQKSPNPEQHKQKHQKQAEVQQESIPITLQLLTQQQQKPSQAQKSESQQKHQPQLQQNCSQEQKQIKSQKQRSDHQHFEVEHSIMQNLSQNPSINYQGLRGSIDETSNNVEKQKLVKLTRFLLKDVNKIKEAVANLEGAMKGIQYIRSRVKTDKLFNKKIRHKVYLMKTLAEL